MSAPALAYRTEELLAALPYARRLARALVREREAGDALVATALRNLPTDASNARLALYAAVAAAAPRVGPAAPGVPELAQAGRCMLLLTTIEEQPVATAAAVLGLSVEAGAEALRQARAALQAAAAAAILIVEDEPIIAMDIEALVRRAGHRVVGVAATEAQAIALAQRTAPTLILADINLGRGGDGSRAVARIQELMSVPVIFVTAYPERLLTGQGLEPAFVITKPFDPVTLAVLTYQAVAGASQPI